MKEFQLTKLLLDYLDVDIEDDGKLYCMAPLQYKSKFFTLVPYKDMANFDSEELIPIRPLTNINHAQYLIELFSDVNECESLFEYRDMENNNSKLQGEMRLTYDNGDKPKTLKVFGMKNLNILMGAVLCKMILSGDKFKDNLSALLKLDEKVTESKKSRK